MDLIDTNITTSYGNNQTAIINDYNGYLNISGNSSIQDKFNIAINNTGFTRIGSDEPVKKEYTYDYTGGIQEFVAPYTGNYKVEAWGASGGFRTFEYYGSSSQAVPGLGAYTSGEISLNEGDKLYINVGSQGISGWTADNRLLANIYNGGTIFGGGATDISISSEGDTYNYDNGYISSTRSQSSYLDRIMVAAGGTDVFKNEISNNSYGQELASSDGAVSQLNGYAFGYGLDQYSSNTRLSGGSGYYGGTNGYGGSSYISGYLGSVAMNGSSSNPKCSMEDALSDITCSYHSSGLVFTNTTMKAGYKEMPTHDGTGTMKGNFGNGYARITYLDDAEPDTVTQTPSISAITNVITGKGRFEFLDGTLTATKSINSKIDKVADNYDLNIEFSNNKEVATLKSLDAEPYVARIADVEYTSLKNAIDAANENDEIIILENIDEALSFTIDKNITIDYNGHYINSYGSEYLFTNNANLVLKDSTNTSVESRIYGKGFVYNNSDLQLNNIIFGDTNTSGGLIYNNSNLNMKNVTAKLYDYSSKSSQILYNSATGIASIENSTLYGSNNASNAGGYFIDNFGELSIKDTTYSYRSNTYYLRNNTSSKLTLDNITITLISGDQRYIQNHGECIIKNTNTKMNIENNTDTLTLENNTITGGTFTNNSTGLTHVISGTYNNTFNINGTGQTIDETDKLYSFIMDQGSINTTELNGLKMAL